MGKKDVRLDTYIANAADFAKPILKHIRKLVHAAYPDVEETLKWSFPHFEHKGILCSMAAFKNHCSFGFWKGALILAKAARNREDDAMGQFGRITSIADLPDEKTMIGYIKEAVRLNDEGIKLPAKTKPREKKEFVVPEYFIAALKKNKKALTSFENFSPSHKREYVEWVTEAKREETRKARLEKAIAMLAEGKSRYWKDR